MPWRRFANFLKERRRLALLLAAALTASGPGTLICQQNGANSSSLLSVERDALPDGPVPQIDRAELPKESPHPTQLNVVATNNFVPLQNCPYDTTHAQECRVHWKPLLISSAVFLTWQNTANVYSSYWYRYETTHGVWLQRYFDSVLKYQYTVWSDGNPFLDDYVGHPLMGAITNSLWIQNDPKGMTLAFSNTRPYWKSRLRAMAFSTVYSVQWKLGPFGESGIGHMSDHLAYDANGTLRNQTGMVSMFTTPIGGTLWTVAEDLIDRSVITRLEQRSRNPILLVTYQLLNPGRGTGNMLRFRPPWFRDSRTVKANSFWSDPDPATSSRDEPRTPRASTTAVSITPSRQPTPLSIPFGGTHELGAWWGISMFSGSLWGDVQNVKYMPIDVRYSYLFLQRRHWALRYSPEITALAMLNEPVPNGVPPFDMRKRTYGGGISPEGLQLDFRPRSRVQPFFSQNFGGIYFADKVLSPEGSQFMFTIDFGGGVNIFLRQRQAFTLGYRYQHLANANISLQNPGTDTNTFYVGISRFRPKRGSSTY